MEEQFDLFRIIFIVIFLLFYFFLFFFLKTKKASKYIIRCSIFACCFIFTLLFYCCFYNDEIACLEKVFYSFSIFFGDKPDCAKCFEVDILKFFSRLSLIAILFSQVSIIYDYLSARFGDVYIVHGDKDRLLRIKDDYVLDSSKKLVICGKEEERLFDFAKKHVLLYGNETDNLRACEHILEIDKKFKKMIYLSTVKTDPTQYNDGRIAPFNIEDMVARQFCIEHAKDIFTDKESRFTKKIGVVGNGSLFHKLYPQLLKNFIFDSNVSETGNAVGSSQKIEYFLFTDSKDTASVLAKLKTWTQEGNHWIDNKKATNDEITVKGLNDIYECYKDMDVIISCDQNMILNEELCLRMRADRKLFIYNSSYVLKEMETDSDNVYYFGSEDFILSIDKIVNDRVVELAKNINNVWMYSTVLITGDKDNIAEVYSRKDKEKIDEIFDEYSNKYKNEADANWIYTDSTKTKKRSAYESRSSIASAVHSMMIRDCFKDYYDALPDNKKEQVEHIRWVRFMEFEGWTFGSRDYSNKFHPDIKYEIDLKEKAKDLLIVELCNRFIEEKQ